MVVSTKYRLPSTELSVVGITLYVSVQYTICNWA